MVNSGVAHKIANYLYLVNSSNNTWLQSCVAHKIAKLLISSK